MTGTGDDTTGAPLDCAVINLADPKVEEQVRAELELFEGEIMDVLVDADRLTIRGYTAWSIAPTATPAFGSADDP